ncbi:MAG: hypothetical protein LBM28_01385 [Oscillospiraceae bacterium]|jgi:hypothetical protein|nr:hypothetical protein [Oscillospiraceae bacterium]
MEKKKQSPERHSELRDPKLPAVNATAPANGAEKHVCPAPIAQQEQPTF